MSRITGELQNHLGINDKTLAEFVIDQHLQCGSFPEFKSHLESMGAEFPQSLMESIDHLVLTMHPKYKSKKTEGTEDATEGNDDMDALDALFKGLAVPDREQRWGDDGNHNGAGASGQDGVDEGDAKADAMDDTFAMLEGLAGKARGEENKGYHRRKKTTGVSGNEPEVRSMTITIVDADDTTNTVLDRGRAVLIAAAERILMSTSLAVLGVNTTAETMTTGMATVSGAEDETVMMTIFNGRRRWS